jgi:hypothetical protein
MGPLRVIADGADEESASEVVPAASGPPARPHLVVHVEGDLLVVHGVVAAPGVSVARVLWARQVPAKHSL